MPTTHYKMRVTLFRGVPFDPSYKHVMEPDTRMHKLETLKEKFTWEEIENVQTLRADSINGTATIRLTCVAAHAYQVNYMYVDDLQHGIQWFCFVHGCRYINDANTNPNTTLSTEYRCVFEFQLTKDVMMTNFRSTSDLYATSIKRHTPTATFNNPYYTEDIQPQTIQYFHNSINKQLDYYSPENDTYSVVWFTLKDLQTNSGMYGIVNSAVGIVYDNPETARQDIYDTLSEQAGFELLGVNTMPKFMFDFENAPSMETLNGKLLETAYTKDLIVVNWKTKNELKQHIINQAGYTPKNKKCFYYPFTFFRLESNAGSIVDMTPEGTEQSFGTDATIDFLVYCYAQRPVSITVVPFRYSENMYWNNNAGFTVGVDSKANMRCTTSSYPEGVAAIDSYAQYLAQRYKFPGNPIGMFAQHVVEAVPGITSGALGVGTNPEKDNKRQEAGGAFALGTIGSVITGAEQGALAADAMKRRGDVLVGSIPSPDTDYMMGNIDVQIELYSVPPAELKGLDDWFERNGYNQGGEIATPDVTGRDRYVYVETLGDCYNSPECNQNEKIAINNIFRSGVTIWKRSAISAELTYGNNGPDPVADAM